LEVTQAWRRGGGLPHRERAWLAASEAAAASFKKSLRVLLGMGVLLIGNTQEERLR
jgi:hypothetical protein